MIYPLTAGALLSWLVLAWLTGTWLGLKSPDIWILRAVLALIGISAAIVVLWFRIWSRAKEKEEGSAAEAPAPEADELALLLRDAENKLASSRLGSDARFRSLPVFFVIGPEGSTKTTAVLQSGLEPELLAGQVYRDSVVIPTGLANVWFAKQAVFVEVGSKVQADSNMWARLIRRMQPGKMRSVMSKGQAAPRAAIVCCECENLLKPGATEAAAETARQLRVRLTDIATILGINLPVYVLFTKLDRLAFFLEYVRNFDNKEAAQVLGVTLPFLDKTGEVYAEKQSTRLSGAFHELVYSLSEKRPEFLARESDANARAGVYEFPREFRKLRGPLVQFLVELCRPSRLTTGPFLRGFYFSGVRPVVIQEELAAEARGFSSSGRAEEVHDPDATSMFRYGPAAPLARAAAAPATRMASRKIPQWVFLNHLFGDVLLQDRAALGASGASVKTNLLRRAVLGAAALLCLFAGIGFLTSFLRNRSLVAQVRGAANDIAADPSSPALVSGLPTRDSLTRLETLRQSLARLGIYEREGPPLSMRWGLYTGSKLLPDTRRIYFDRFKQLLFGGTQQSLLAALNSLPRSPGPKADYGYTYNTLKAYLETTSHPDKATLDFLPPLLQDRWLAGRAIDPERLKLARKQFDFYTSELRIKNPYSSENDARAVESARKYLAQFAGPDRVYQVMLTEANKSIAPVMFNRLFKDSAEVVTNTREMAGAYTKPGFVFMQAAMKNPGKYVNGELWVLGDQAAAAIDSSKLEQDLRGRFYNDYIRQWRDYLKKSAIVKYANLADAAKKLTATSSPQSPLLALFWLASQNTAVDAPEIEKAFKPLHALMPPASVDQYLGPSNSDYMKALASLQIAVEQASALPPEQNETAAAQTKTSANAAKLAARQTALTFGLDSDAHIEATIAKLMEDAITYAEAAAPQGPDPGPLNAAGAGLCAQFRKLAYPFNARSTNRAKIEDVNAIFRPGQGALWAFYEQNLKKLLPKNGDSYAPVAGGKPALNKDFVNFFNKAAAFSNALYQNGASQEPKLTFALKPAFGGDITSVTLTLDGQTVNFQPDTPAAKFNWPGTDVRMVAKSKIVDSFPWTYTGLWAVFEYFQDADKPAPSPEWWEKQGAPARPVYSSIPNQPLGVHFDLDMMGAPPVFQKGYFRDMSCVSEVAK
ncbi:MAG: hypothetical protein M3Z23_02250 [Acidobacteriota bacterium]|nr:hypothetical protein [Acidobacteriota bacterium]